MSAQLPSLLPLRTKAMNTNILIKVKGFDMIRGSVNLPDYFPLLYWHTKCCSLNILVIFLLHSFYLCLELSSLRYSQCSLLNFLQSTVKLCNLAVHMILLVYPSPTFHIPLSYLILLHWTHYHLASSLFYLFILFLAFLITLSTQLGQRFLSIFFIALFPLHRTAMTYSRYSQTLDDY